MTPEAIERLVEERETWAREAQDFADRCRLNGDAPGVLFWGKRAEVFAASAADWKKRAIEARAKQAEIRELSAEYRNLKNPFEQP